MFIKLTKFDNRPVWLNAAFIVTVEPRRDGNGAVVVPIGDGLDYDVRESPEDVLRLLDGAPAPAVVPVPVSDCLTKTPADVSPEPAAEPPAEATKPKKRATRSRAKASAAPKATKASAKASATDSAEPPAESVAEEPAAPADPPKAELELSEADVLRLRKLGPKSLGKLKNTLATQFMVVDISANVAALAEKGVLALDGNKVLWKAEAQG